MDSDIPLRAALWKLSKDAEDVVMAMNMPDSLDNLIDRLNVNMFALRHGYMLSWIRIMKDRYDPS